MSQGHGRGGLAGLTCTGNLLVFSVTSVCLSEYRLAPGDPGLLPIVGGATVGGPLFPSAAPSDILPREPCGPCRLPGPCMQAVLWVTDGPLGVGLQLLRPQKHAPAGHPALGWGWRWAECPPDMPVCPPNPRGALWIPAVSAPSATGGSAGALSRVAVSVGPERTSPRSSSLEFRVSRAPCRALGMPGRTLPQGPERVSTRAPTLPAFTAPTTGGPPSAFRGQQGSWKETSSRSGGLPAPQSLSPPRVPLSPWPPGWQWSQSCHQPQLVCPRSEGG